MIRGLNHITLAVRDIEQSLAFYSELLGLRPIATWPKGAYLLAGDLWLALVVDAAARSTALAEYSHVAFTVHPADFAQLSQAIRSAGVPLWQENWTEGDSLYFVDPNGHKLEIHASDLAARLRSARAQPWEGLQLFDAQDAEPLPFSIQILTSDSSAYQQLLDTATQLDQARYITAAPDVAASSVLLGAFTPEQCVGFLRFVIQVIGQGEQRPAIIGPHGQALTEGYVEAFGVLPTYRCQGIGEALQGFAIDYCRDQHCYQMRSRSPVTSVENYALKLKMGYAVHPSHENDSYYFIKALGEVRR